MALIASLGGGKGGTVYSYSCTRYTAGSSTEGQLKMMAYKDGEVVQMAGSDSRKNPTLTYDGITVTQNENPLNYAISGFVGKVYGATSISDPTPVVKATIVDGSTATTITDAPNLNIALIPD